MEAEGLLEIEGEFLVRESTKITGQFVLTGMAHSEPQHLLLMDKTGKVCVRAFVCVYVSRGARQVPNKQRTFFKGKRRWDLNPRHSACTPLLVHDCL